MSWRGSVPTNQIPNDPGSGRKRCKRKRRGRWHTPKPVKRLDQKGVIWTES